MLAASLRRAYPSYDPLTEDIVLELRDGAEDRIKHFAGGGRRVDVLGQRSQRSIALVEGLGDLEQIS